MIINKHQIKTLFILKKLVFLELHFFCTISIFLELKKVYKDTLDDLQIRYEAKFKEITGLYEDKIKLLQDEITILKRSIKQLKEENILLRQRLKENYLE